MSGIDCLRLSICCKREEQIERKRHAVSFISCWAMAREPLAVLAGQWSPGARAAPSTGEGCGGAQADTAGRGSVCARFAARGTRLTGRPLHTPLPRLASQADPQPCRQGCVFCREAWIAAHVLGPTACYLGTLGMGTTPASSCHKGKVLNIIFHTPQTPASPTVPPANRGFN